jgi:hypothetical protein
MSDIYQATYDAVLKKLFNCDIGSAVSDAIHNSAIDHTATIAGAAIQELAMEVANSLQRPSVLFKPELYIVDNKWCAQYGAIMNGYGDTPAEAMADFDTNWNALTVQIAEHM